MKIITSALFFVLLTAVLGQTAENSTTTETTTVVTTTESPTTTEKSTTTTLEPTTTTVETTSRASTTTIMPTSSSTAISSSTTAVPIPSSSLSPSTTKAPEPAKCQFNVTEGNLTCIRADLQADFSIDYQGKKYPIMLGCGASWDRSDCSSNNTQTLVLSESTYSLTMVFEKLAGKVLVKNVTFTYNIPGGPEGIASSHSEDLFNVKVGNSYLCKSKSDIHLENVTMEIYEIHIQAFVEEGKTYGATEECEADEKVNDIVPIAVGIALAALIIIVLIAYLVGRRRSRQMGYQSV